MGCAAWCDLEEHKLCWKGAMHTKIYTALLKDLEKSLERLLNIANKIHFQDKRSLSDAGEARDEMLKKLQIRQQQYKKQLALVLGGMQGLS